MATAWVEIYFFSFSVPMLSPPQNKNGVFHLDTYISCPRLSFLVETNVYQLLVVTVACMCSAALRIFLFQIYSFDFKDNKFLIFLFNQALHMHIVSDCGRYFLP
jgi:hypothetical protein